MAAHLWSATRTSASGLKICRSGPFQPSHPRHAPFSSSASSAGWPRPLYSSPWSALKEPEKPPNPYRKGFQFTARRVKPPPPFLGQYIFSRTKGFRAFLRHNRFPGDQFLRTTTQVDYCVSVASKPPLPCKDLGETVVLEVTHEITVGDGPDRGRGSQVVACLRRDSSSEPLVAKIFDPLYYPFADDDFPEDPADVIVRAEHDFALESAAYSQLGLDKSLGGTVISRFYGSWLLHLPLKQLERPIGLVLMEHVNGVPLDTLDPELYTQEERLRVMALVMEAAVRLEFAGVIHEDIAPRNVICSSSDLRDDNLRVRIIDFGFVTVLPLRGGDTPCESEALPKSPLERFWRSGPYEMRAWEPDAWGGREWTDWLRETYGGSKRFKPVPENCPAVPTWKPDRR